MENGRTFVAGTLNLSNIVGGTPNNYAGTRTLEITGVTIPSRTVAQITVQVQVPRTTSPGTIFNQSTLSGLPPAFGGPDLLSDYPPTGGYPDATPLIVTQSRDNPAIGVAKAVASVAAVGDGNFRVTYNIAVRNLGNVDLNNVQLTENLSNTFGRTPFTVDRVSSPGGNLTPNRNFNGVNVTNLLAGTDTLSVGETKRIRLVVTVTPGNNRRSYENQVRAIGRTPDGTPTRDTSTNGTNPDPDNDGDPTNNNDPTPVQFTGDPTIGVAKAVASLVNLGNGNFRATYNITVQNLGNVNLSNVQVTENLSDTFGRTPFTVNRVSSPSGNLTPNANFNGVNVTNLLAGTDTLSVGETKTIRLVVTFTPIENSGSYENQVRAIGQTPDGTPTRDTSTNGTNPDPDEDGNPTNNNDPTIVDLAPPTTEPRLRLVKRITNVTRGGVPVGGINFNRVVDDPNDEDDDASGWSQLPGRLLGVPQLGSDTPLRSGDEVEYTVYFLSDGGQPTTNVNVCDPIPARTTFIPESFGAGSGILLNRNGTPRRQTNVSDRDAGTFFSPLTPVNAPCADTNNPNGSVFLQLGDIPISAPNNVGFVRFRVRID
jgi:uncharacterized repeat protein (TIGR01451 family)